MGITDATTSMLRTVSRHATQLRAHARLAHNQVARTPAEPHTPPQVSTAQSPNRETTWSKSQAPRSEAMVGPRFEQTSELFQPRPLAAIELIKEEPFAWWKGVSLLAMAEGELWDTPESSSTWTKKARTAAPTAVSAMRRTTTPTATDTLPAASTGLSPSDQGLV